MLQRIAVHKTQGRDLPEGGTAGVIDVRTKRPFDFKGRQVTLNAQIEHRDKARTTNPDVSAAPAPSVDVFAEGFRTNIDQRYQDNVMIGFRRTSAARPSRPRRAPTISIPSRA
ncbi:hypothetical protein HF313_25965 [Massilia atriviolacea]|uniref:TonB-dependent receptor n=1 Tax=Massilia atriviolacea TaxID=2495579 RepID=A0A430HN16_9BURK|nr:hypothetical protein [Massilia atriviolacea]RSZ58889.1 hypothetical protein EJB06_11130 [Massilia atriviolacea]